jgi:hypothetical protein
VHESDPAPISGEQPEPPPIQYAAYPREPTNSLYKPFNIPIKDVDPQSPEEVRKGTLHRRIIVITFILGLLAYGFVTTTCDRQHDEDVLYAD